MDVMRSCPRADASCERDEVMVQWAHGLELVLTYLTNDLGVETTLV